MRKRPVPVVTNCLSIGVCDAGLEKSFGVPGFGGVFDRNGTYICAAY
jgi:hypothetical protein